MEANSYGIKLLISLYDKNTLAAGGVCKFLICLYSPGLSRTEPVALDNAKYTEEGFYTSSAALNDYNQVRHELQRIQQCCLHGLQRITHILNIHKNSLLGNQPWSDLSEYIIGYDVMNELVTSSLILRDKTDTIGNR